MMLLALLVYSKNSSALPIDWQGEITFDHHYLSNARLIEETGAGSGNTGSTEIPNKPNLSTVVLFAHIKNYVVHS